MSKNNDSRNFGFGKQMAWAGKQALLNHYGDGHYATVSSHVARWKVISAWCQNVFGIKDARLIDRSVIETFGQVLATRVNEGATSVRYAQNLLSTFNVVLEAMRGDSSVRVSPSAMVGKRSNILEHAPAGLARETVRQCTDHIRSTGQDGVASVAELTRDLGLRLREASMLDARKALQQAKSKGEVNITVGTKGGRGTHADRWVSASATAIRSLERAAAVQGSGRNSILPALSWKQWNDRVHYVWSIARDSFGLETIHDLRKAYACDRYEQITGFKAPVITGYRQASREQDRKARDIIARELGHSRRDVVAAYIGSAK